MRENKKFLVLILLVLMPYRFAVAATDGAPTYASAVVQYFFFRLQNEIVNYSSITKDQRNEYALLSAGERQVVVARHVEAMKGYSYDIWQNSESLKAGDTLGVHFVRGLMAAALDVAGIDNPGDNLLTGGSNKEPNVVQQEFNVAFGILAKFLSDDPSRTIEDFAKQALANRPNGFYQRHLDGPVATNLNNFSLPEMVQASNAPENAEDGVQADAGQTNTTQVEPKIGNSESGMMSNMTNSGYKMPIDVVMDFVRNNQSFHRKELPNDSDAFSVPSTNPSVTSNPTSNSESPTVSNSTTMPQHGEMGNKPVAAIAYGDSSFSNAAKVLLPNRTFGAYGELTGFTMEDFSPAEQGQASSATVCQANECTESASIRWGTWNNGTVNVSGRTFTANSNDPLHYIVGFPTDPQFFNTLSGTAVYAPVGGTQATGNDGITYTSTIGNISVDFNASPVPTVVLSRYALSGGSINSADYSFSNITLGVFPGTEAVILSAAESNANTALTIHGFFAAGVGDHIGLSFKSSSRTTSHAIQQVQAFKR